MDTQTETLVTIPNAALQLGLAETTVRGWILTRKIAYIKLLGRSIRIKQSTIDAVIAEGTVEPLSFDDLTKPVTPGRTLKLAA
jgi:excisionase family DNA binding protein